jgi:hypothetical protein
VEGKPVALDESDVRHVSAILARLQGETVREAGRSPLAGSWIDIEFDRGLIWIEAPWRLETATEFLLACEDPRDRIGEMITVLTGRRLTTIAPNRYLDLTLDFEGHVLSTFNAGSPRADAVHWTIQLSGEGTLFAGPGHAWSFVKSP